MNWISQVGIVALFAVTGFLVGTIYGRFLEQRVIAQYVKASSDAAGAMVWVKARIAHLL